jgi:hypothetical protein
LSAMSSTSFSTRACAGVCAIGKYSPLLTMRVGTGGESSAALRQRAP